MYEKLNDVTLKNGEQVELGIVKGPDLEWADRMCTSILIFGIVVRACLIKLNGQVRVDMWPIVT